MSRDGYGHICTVTGASWRPKGRYFDGTDDDINLGDPATLELGLGYTIVCWANKSDASRVDMFIAKISDGWSTGEWQFYFSSDDTLNFQAYDTTTRIVNTTNTYSNNRWYHVAVSNTGSGANETIIYVDGEEAANGTVGTIGDATCNLYIGRAQATGGYYYKGLIGEVLIYNRGLNPLEIQHNYLATKGRYQ